ncbi:MAG TPA: stage II sporulation protein M [Candidatus Nanoarchaeia archaeon]|nr:stage II sporulation protein M [Candidatus Nanoarchaeia archaeon]
MLKILFDAKKAKKHPWEMMMIAIFYSSISIFLGSWIFPEYSSLIIIFLTVFSCSYIIQSSIKIEETKEKNYNTESFLLKEHSKLLKILLFLFIGFVISFSFWSFILPEEKISTLFSLQEETIKGVRSMAVTGDAINKDVFKIIFLNNIKVLSLSFLLALFYGAGAIFVLTWNASIMGLVIGTLTKNIGGIFAMPVAFTKYFLHGIPEMLSYLIIILAGGIISTSIIKGDILKKGKTRRIITDTIILVIISISLMTVAALIEVYISPLI